jgi:hypothetical protein
MGQNAIFDRAMGLANNCHNHDYQLLVCLTCGVLFCGKLILNLNI